MTQIAYYSAFGVYQLIGEALEAGRHVSFFPSHLPEKEVTMLKKLILTINRSAKQLLAGRNIQQCGDAGKNAKKLNRGVL